MCPPLDHGVCSVPPLDALPLGAVARWCGGLCGTCFAVCCREVLLLLLGTPVHAMLLLLLLYYPVYDQYVVVAVVVVYSRTCHAVVVIVLSPVTRLLRDGRVRGCVPWTWGRGREQRCRGTCELNDERSISRVFLLDGERLLMFVV